MDSLINTAPVGFLLFDDGGMMLDANATLADILGREAGFHAGLRFESILSTGGRIFYQTHVFPLLKLHGKVQEIYLSLRTAEGTEIPVLMNAARREKDGAAVNECVLMPILQRGRYEDEILLAKKSAEDATRAKDEFLAIVSHDLRTPLNAILGWVSMLRSGKMGGDAMEKGLATIESSAKSQSRLIEDILDFSRIISGKLRLSVERVQPVNFIEAAVDVVRPAAEAKNVRLQCILDPNAGPISGDPDRLQQVMWNLLSNAIKFTPKGGSVQVRLARINSHVDIVVSDTGQGIDAEFLPYVFDRFRQSRDGDRRTSGLGLGMAITRQIIELHGGTIRAESEGEGLGSAFTVELPVLNLQSGQSVPAGTPPADVMPKVPRLDSVRLLIVDDDQDARQLLEAIFVQSGAAVTSVGIAAEALEQLALEKHDLVVSDIDMPNGDGYELIRAIRSLPSEARLTPAIALTAQTRYADRMRALTAGYQIHLAKPVEPDELITLVSNLVNPDRSR